MSLDRRWWKLGTPGEPAKSADAALSMSSVAEGIETWSYGRRFMNLAFMRMWSGRDLPSVYGLAMSRSAAGSAQVAAELASFRTPSFNAIGSCVETLTNKLGRSRPWVQFLSDGGTWEVRTRGKKLTEYSEGIFYASRAYRTGKLCLQDCLGWGDGFAKVSEDEAGDIAIERVIADEILVDDQEALKGNPRSLYQRRFMSRDALLETYASAKRPDIEHAIRNAKSALPGLNFAVTGAAMTDMIALIEGWHLPSLDGKAPGRRLLVVGGCVLQDEVWTRKRFPFAKLPYNPLGFGFWSQGLVEVLAPIQREINRITEVISEAQRRVAVPRILADANSGVTEEDFANKISALTIGNFSGPNGVVWPQFVTPAAMPPEMYQDREAWIAKAYKRSGVAEDSAAGQASEKVRSGAAERLQEDIRSQRFITLGQAYEDWYADLAELVLEQAAETKPQVIIPGRGPLKWTDVKADLALYRLKGFPVSSFPTSPVARLEAAAEALAEGRITGEDYARIIDYPDVRAITDLHTAAARNIDRMLSKMIEDFKPQTPDKYMDLRLALKTSHGRLEYERAMGTPEERLEYVRRFIDQTSDLIDKLAITAAPAAQTTVGSGPGGVTAETVMGGAAGAPIMSQAPAAMPA